MWNFEFRLLLLLLSMFSHFISKGESNHIKTEAFLSPPIHLKPGSVQNKYYFDIPFPRGHIALKSFNGEVVDEAGAPIPLHETYLHHWVVGRYYGKEGVPYDKDKFIPIRNSGPCRNVNQYFGLGSETRRTDTWIHDPYGIQVGDPAIIPPGYEEKWLLNVHAIDTRGVEDRLGCTECKCSLYNVTVDEFGRQISDGYVGGLYCCYDETQCQLNKGFGGKARMVFLKYTVKWVEWNPSIVPVNIYIFDVTDTGHHLSSMASISTCKVEYNVPPCESSDGECVDVKTSKVVLPHGGDIIYGVAHQHTGGLGTALYGEDGQLLCSSTPLYGMGDEAGDEAGYIVGMSTCYPKPGSISIRDGELLTVVSNYSRAAQTHTGVMGLFYVLLAEPQHKPDAMLFHGLMTRCFSELAEHWRLLVLAWGVMAAVAVAIYLRNEGKSYQMVSNNA